MRNPASPFLILAVAFGGFVLAPLHAASAESALGAAVVREMNLARQNPAQYAAFIEEQRASFQGNTLIRPGRCPMRTKEGTRALDEAIRFLRRAAPQGPLAYSTGMSRAAADHCAAQAGGGMTHRGSGGSRAGDRINRYGTWSGRWGENISCGRATAREIVMWLIIDDGQRGRKHRANIFSSDFNYAGAAVGSHAQYRTICSIEFAGGYTESDGRPQEALLAQN